MGKKLTQKTSKMAFDKKDLDNTTLPDPITTGGLGEIGLNRIEPIEIPKYLLMHPALPRGIEIKTNRMVSYVKKNLNLNVILNSKKIKKSDTNLFTKEKLEKLREEALDYCKEVLFNSGGPLFIKKFSMGAYRFGTGFAVLQTNKAETDVIRFEYQHPIFFGPSFYPLDINSPNWGEIPLEKRKYLAGKTKIDLLTKEIDKFSQLTKAYPERNENNIAPGSNGSSYYDVKRNPQLKNNTPGKLVPVGKEIDKEKVITIAFDKLGDEPLGISLVQFLHLTIKYLLGMERGGAQAMVNFGFNKWKAQTPFKDIKKMKEFGKTISNIQNDSVVILPDGVTIENIAPGSTEFDRIHPIYMSLIAIRLGIPLPLLTMSGTSTNKSTLDAQKDDMKDDFIADELVVESSIDDGFFKACKIKFPDLSIKELNYIVPNFKFLPKVIDVDKQKDRDLKDTLSYRNLTMAIDKVLQLGDIDTACLLILNLKKNIIRNLGEEYSEEEHTALKEKMTEMVSSKAKIAFADRNQIKQDEEDIDKQTKDLENENGSSES